MNPSPTASAHRVGGRVFARVFTRFFADTSVSALVAGFVAMMTGYTSSLVLMFQAGRAAHLTDAQISSWIWALSIGMAVTTIGLSPVSYTHL